MYWRSLDASQAQLEQSAARLAMIVTDQQTQIEQLRGELRKRQEASGDLVSAATGSETMSVPYGDSALSGQRLVRLRAMIERLKSEQFRGKLRIATFIGDFCLSGNSLTGYKLANPTASVQACDLVGNPIEDASSSDSRVPQEVTALVTALRNEKNGRLVVELQSEGRKPAVPYPPQNEKIAAGEWNTIATQNNRVEFVAVPAE
jgi:hypothetical protein